MSGQPPDGYIPSSVRDSVDSLTLLVLCRESVDWERNLLKGMSSWTGLQRGMKVGMEKEKEREGGREGGTDRMK